MTVHKTRAKAIVDQFEGSIMTIQETTESIGRHSKCVPFNDFPVWHGVPVKAMENVKRFKKDSRMWKKGLKRIRLVYRLLTTTKADKRMDGYFCGLQKIRKQNGRQKKKRISGDAGAWFTTYHRHRRHPVAHRRQKTNAHTGNGPSRKNGRSRSHAYHARGPGSDRVDHHRSRTWMLHHMQRPRSVVVAAAALAPVKKRFMG